MEIRPYVKTGIAVVSAGVLVAAMPAVVPSPTPPDMKVAAGAQKSVYSDVALKFTSQELLNAIFSGFPTTEGPAGAVGVSLLLSDEFFGADSLPSTFVSGGVIGLADVLTTDAPLVNSFVTGGIVGLATELFGADPVAAAFLDGGIIAVASLLTEGNDVANTFVNEGFMGLAGLLVQGDPVASAFVDSGVIGVASLLTEGNPLANTFVNGGFVPVTEAVLLSLSTDEVVQQGISSFFSGYPFEDGDLPAGPAGVVGLVHYILDRLAGNPTDEEETVMLSVESESGPSLLAEDTGTAADLPDAGAPINPNARSFSLNVAVEPEEEKTPEPDVEETVTAAAATGTAPAAQPAAAPAPSETPAAPATPAANEGEEDDPKEVTEEDMNSGNKVEPETILLERGTGGGGTAWDQTVKRWQDFGKALGFGGAAPAPESTPDTGDAEGGAEGAS